MNKILYDVIRVRTIAEDVLPSEEHLKFCVLKTIAEFAQSVPGIFMQEADAGIKCCTAPALYCIIADLVHLIDDRNHLLGRHTRRNQRLMRVTKDGFHDLNRPFFNCFFSHLMLPPNM